MMIKKVLHAYSQISLIFSYKKRARIGYKEIV